MEDAPLLRARNPVPVHNSREREIEAGRTVGRSDRLTVGLSDGSDGRASPLLRGKGGGRREKGLGAAAVRSCCAERAVSRVRGTQCGAN